MKQPDFIKKIPKHFVSFKRFSIKKVPYKTDIVQYILCSLQKAKNLESDSGFICLNFENGITLCT